MKNIHVLPTDKPSGLFEIIQFNFVFDNQNMYSEEYKKLHSYKNKNIYIINDEDIMINDYFIAGVNIYQCLSSAELEDLSIDSYCKKIILTTDQDLIKDGVQAIDDEFLEWFVKNPSCEWVDVWLMNKGYNKQEDYPYQEHYLIIIPKEETKKKHKVIIVGDGLPKQETLEEAAAKYARGWGEYDDKKAFIKGAKWQQERMYNEEEVLNFTQTIIQQYKLGNTNIEQLDLLKETLQQFKNK